MLERMKKVVRFIRQKDEFNLTPHESVVLNHTLQTLCNGNSWPLWVALDSAWDTNVKSYNKAHLALWDVIMQNKNRPADLVESNLQDVMQSLAVKLLTQQEKTHER